MNRISSIEDFLQYLSGIYKKSTGVVATAATDKGIRILNGFGEILG